MVQKAGSSQDGEKILREKLRKKDKENIFLKEKNEFLERINKQLLEELRELKVLRDSLSFFSDNAKNNSPYRALKNLLMNNFTEEELGDIFSSKAESNSDENEEKFFSR